FARARASPRTLLDQQVKLPTGLRCHRVARADEEWRAALADAAHQFAALLAVGIENPSLAREANTAALPVRAHQALAALLRQQIDLPRRRDLDADIGLQTNAGRLPLVVAWAAVGRRIDDDLFLRIARQPAHRQQPRQTQLQVAEIVRFRLERRRGDAADN